MSNTSKKISYKEFIERSIKALRKPPFKGIHVVYSGFNDAFRQYYGEEPRLIVDELVKEGFLVCRPARGGAMILLATEDTGESSKSGADALAKILSKS